MKRVAFETIGCRLNQYDTEIIAAQMNRLGFRRVDFAEDADLYIINTCTVTGRADATCRNIISRAARRNGNPPVVVVGCYVDSDTDRVVRLNGVDLVVNNQDKERIAEILQDRFPQLFEGSVSVHVDSLTDFYEHNRAWIKIGDGCNQRCSYCIIPAVRGELTNRPADRIVNEINALSENGFNEIVLTGIHIGMYNYGNIKSPGELVNYILRKTSISRIRLSSIEPQEVDGDLIKAMNDGGDRVCRHLHIPLQSGSDRVLKMMRRPYDAQKYLDIVRNVKEKVESVTIGADIIVGFPGETEDDFAGSVLAAESGYLDYLHVFSYSDRPGTDASRLPDKIKPGVIKRRNKVLRDISDRNYAEALKRQVGRIAYVISEHRVDRNDRYWGVTGNYLLAAMPPDQGGGKELLKMRIVGAADSYLTGEII